MSASGKISTSGAKSAADLPADGDPPQISKVVVEPEDGQLVGPGLALSAAGFASAVSLFKLLSDNTRLEILQQLTHGEVNVSTLCQRLSLPQPTVSHHLALLRNSSLIDNRRDGKQVFYRLNGRVSPAGVAGTSELRHTKGGDDITRDVDGDGKPDLPTGLSIRGAGYTLQLLTADLDHQNEPDALEHEAKVKSAGDGEHSTSHDR